MSNGGYFQIESGSQEREKVIRSINDGIDEMVRAILDPPIDFEEQLKSNKFFAQGQAGLEKLRWDYRAGRVEV